MTGEAELFPAFSVGDRVVWSRNPMGCVCEHGTVAMLEELPSGETRYWVRWDADHGRWNGAHPVRFLRIE